MVNELKSMVGNEETILYEGKPDKKCFLFESIFNPLLPVPTCRAPFNINGLRRGLDFHCNNSSIISRSIYACIWCYSKIRCKGTENK